MKEVGQRPREGRMNEGIIKQTKGEGGEKTSPALLQNKTNTARSKLFL